MTRIKVPLHQNDDINVLTIHNEEESDWGMHIVQGYETENVLIELRLSTLREMVDDDSIENIVSWLEANAETHLRAQAHREEEQERHRQEAYQERHRIEKSQKKTSRPGYVYLIRADNGMYKIGKAVNVDNRIHEFGVKLPMKTELIHSFKSNDYTAAEQELHRRYADLREHGEWFSLTSECVIEICAITDGAL